MRNFILKMYPLITLIGSCQGGILNSTNHEEQKSTTTQINMSSPIPTTVQKEMTTEKENIVLTRMSLDDSTSSVDNDSRIAIINENQLPYRSHMEGITVTAPTTTTTSDEDHYEDRDDYPPDWSIWASSWSTPRVIEEDEEEPRRLVIEEEGPEDGDGIPDVEDIGSRRRNFREWYVLFIQGNEDSIKSSLKRQDFIDDLKLNLASRLAVRYEELHLNRLTSTGDELRANFTITSFHENDLIKRLSELVSKDILSFSGEVFVLKRILKSDSQIPETPSISHIHPYSHTTTSLKGDSRGIDKDDQVELMLYLTIGGLCIFLFVVALSFLALQLVKSGGRNELEEDDENENEDWKLLLTAVNTNNSGRTSSFSPSEGANGSSYSLNSHSHVGRPYVEGNIHCDECEIERQQAAKRQNVMNSSTPMSNSVSGSLSALGDWTSKFINSFRISGKYIDLNH